MKYFTTTILCLLFCFNGYLASAQKNETNRISLSFKEIPTALATNNNGIQVEKFSDYLKIIATGTTVYNGESVPFKVTLSLPGFNFINEKKNHYKNESSHFFDARKDAALSLSLGEKTFGTLYRSKEKGAILSQVATTDYEINVENIKTKKGNYTILITVMPGSTLMQGSETLSKEEIPAITFADDVKSTIEVQNPQPELPKAKPYIFNGSSEVIGHGR